MCEKKPQIACQEQARVHCCQLHTEKENLMELLFAKNQNARKVAGVSIRGS